MHCIGRLHFQQRMVVRGCSAPSNDKWSSNAHSKKAEAREDLGLFPSVEAYQR